MAWDKTKPADGTDCATVDDEIRANFSAIEDALGSGTLATINSIVQGDILYGSAANTLVRLGPGTSGQFLKTQGAGANPLWANSSVGVPMTLAAGAGDDEIALTITNADGNNALYMDINAELDASKHALWVQSDGVAQTTSGLVLFDMGHASSDQTVVEIDNPGTGHSLYVQQTGVLATTKHGLIVTTGAAQVNADAALLKLVATNASNTEPLLELANNGTWAAVEITCSGNGPHLRFTGDPTVASPNDGDIWFDGTNLKIQIGATTYNIDKTAA